MAVSEGLSCSCNWKETRSYLKAQLHWTSCLAHSQGRHMILGLSIWAPTHNIFHVMGVPQHDGRVLEGGQSEGSKRPRCRLHTTPQLAWESHSCTYTTFYWLQLIEASPGSRARELDLNCQWEDCPRIYSHFNLLHYYYRLWWSAFLVVRIHQIFVELNNAIMNTAPYQQSHSIN